MSCAPNAVNQLCQKIRALDSRLIQQQSEITSLGQDINNVSNNIATSSVDNLEIYISQIGDDTNDGLTVPTAVQSLERAFEIARNIGWNDTANVFVLSNGGPVEVDVDSRVNFTTRNRGLQRNPLIISGELTQVASGSIVSATPGPVDDILDIVTTPVLGAVDSQAGNIMEFTSGALSGLRIMIGTNTSATDAVLALSSNILNPGDTFNIYQRDSTFRINKRLYFDGDKETAVLFRDLNFEFVNNSASSTDLSLFGLFQVNINWNNVEIRNTSTLRELNVLPINSSLTVSLPIAIDIYGSGVDTAGAYFNAPSGTEIQFVAGSLGSPSHWNIAFSVLRGDVNLRFNGKVNMNSIYAQDSGEIRIENNGFLEVDNIRIVNNVDEAFVARDGSYISVDDFTVTNGGGLSFDNAIVEISDGDLSNIQRIDCIGSTLTCFNLTVNTLLNNAVTIRNSMVDINTMAVNNSITSGMIIKGCNGSLANITSVANNVNGISIEECNLSLNVAVCTNNANHGINMISSNVIGSSLTGVGNTAAGIAIFNNSHLSGASGSSTLTGAGGDVALGIAGFKTWALIAGGAAVDRNDYTLAFTQNCSVN